jgi:hypothetical protein
VELVSNLVEIQEGAVYLSVSQEELVSNLVEIQEGAVYLSVSQETALLTWRASEA